MRKVLVIGFLIALVALPVSAEEPFFRFKEFQWKGRPFYVGIIPSWEIYELKFWIEKRVPKGSTATLTTCPCPLTDNIACVYQLRDAIPRDLLEGVLAARAMASPRCQCAALPATIGIQYPGWRDLPDEQRADYEFERGLEIAGKAANAMPRQRPQR